MASMFGRLSFLNRSSSFLNIPRDLDTIFPASHAQIPQTCGYTTTVREELFEKAKKYRETKIEEPSKLLMVYRIKPLYGRPYWEKDVLKELHIDENRSDYAIVKNTPSTVKLLTKVKHLVRIKPITFPNGLPKDGDIEGTFLKPTGEFIVSPKLKVDERRFLTDPKKEKVKMDTETLRRELWRHWHI